VTHEQEVDRLLDKLRILNERVWERRVERPAITEWLRNYADELYATAGEAFHALFLLSQFVYFGDREVRELLRSMYRDLYRYPIVEELRRASGDTLDYALLGKGFREELAATRFLGIGNPAESGTHLLYYFRQENRVPKANFSTETQLFDRRLDDPDLQLADPAVKRLVFIDDFCGSGNQATAYSNKLLRVLRDVAHRAGRPLHTSYLVLVASVSGLERVRNNTLFDRVDAVFELDTTYKSLELTSRHFTTCPGGITREAARTMAAHYGGQLFAAHPLGYQDGQLLLGFHHNVPDNTLPIIWWDEAPSSWTPILRRYPKV